MDIVSIGASLGYAIYSLNGTTPAQIAIITIYAIWYLMSTWIAFAIYAKRWHDCGKSAWMSLILFMPVIGSFWLLGYCGFVRGTSGINQYGEDTLNINNKSNN